MKNKNILNLIVEIQHYSMEIFEEQDSDYVDNRIVIAKEKAILRRLEKITPNKELQYKIWRIIETEMWNAEDYTYKPIFDELKKLNIGI